MDQWPPSEANPVVCDVGAITDPDAVALDALVRLALTARRMGTEIELRNACPQLVDLIAISGLTDVLVVGGPTGGTSSVIEVDGQVEQGEQ